MGNAIIVKPSNYNPLTLIEYVKLMIEAGVPAGCIQILTGDGPIAGQALARNPKSTFSITNRGNSSRNSNNGNSLTKLNTCNARIRWK